MTDSGVKDCQAKFHRVLELITPEMVISDDTFLEKLHSYLRTNKGKFTYRRILLPYSSNFAKQSNQIIFLVI